MLRDMEKKTEMVPPFTSFASELEGNPLHISLDSMKISPEKYKLIH